MARVSILMLHRLLENALRCDLGLHIIMHHRAF
jgi:hypothetical protein